MDDFLDFLRLETDLFRRRLRGMAMIARGIVPNLVISQRMVERVLAAARHFLADETGESMVGLIIEPQANDPESMPTIVVLDTISPDSAVIRRSHMFEHGDELQTDLYNWLKDNWDAYQNIGRDMENKTIRPEWEVPLRHLGDWHKQPGFMIQPSGGDLMTALTILDDDEQEFEFLLVPIVTLGHETVTSEEGARVNYFTVPQNDGTSLRMDWWYIHRDVRIFQPITPKIIPSKELPMLTPYPWHILDVDRMDEELALMEDHGLILINGTVVLWEEDHDLPLEICFVVARGATPKALLIETDWNYPAAAPRARISDFAGIRPDMYIYEIYERLRAKAEVVNLPPSDFVWSQEKRLVDFIQAVEKHLGLPTHAARNPTPRRRVQANQAITIPVEVDGRSAPPAKSAKPTKKSARRRETAAIEDEE